ncbi:MAG: AraC family transcriptional regulator [Paenibacillus sp.]|nr:AraC family transcriptional regulator [Paenibacillus sp.]
MEHMRPFSVDRRDNVIYATVAHTGELPGELPSELLLDGRLRHHMLLMVDVGRARLERENGGFVLFPDSCWLLHPGERIRIIDEGELSLRCRAVAFDVWHVGQGTREESTSGLSPAALEAAIFPFSGLLDHHLAQEVRRWMDAAAQSDVSLEHRNFFLSIRFLDVLLNLLISGTERQDGKDWREAIQKTVLLMEQSYAQPITREQLAKLANMSASHYSSVFKREIGKSPMEKLTEIRIRHAKKQLLFSDRKLRDIAESVGYRNEFYFSRQFKQVIGVSPKEFARRHFANHVEFSHPFPLHMQSLGLTTGSAERTIERIRVVGLYVEDFLIALGVQPILKCVGNSFRQSYLNAYLNGVQEWSLLSFDFEAIADVKPDLIILGHPDYGSNGKFARFSEIAPTYSIRKRLHHWEHGVRMIGQLLNRLPQAESIITQHEQFVQQARSQLAAVSGQTVALVRICNDRRIRLYGGPDGYSGVVLYHDLGLKPADSVMRLAWDKPSGYAAVGSDVLYELEAEHLFIVVDPAGQSYWNQLASDPRWSRLPSVQANRCYEVRFDIWMTFGIIAHRLKLQDVLRFLAPPAGSLPTIVYK